MSEEEVNWSHLPHSPELFFGCDDSSSRRDLKRAYNKILKKFKPEQFPDEFKKIRKAFEDLDARISYGLKSTSVFLDFSESEDEGQESLDIVLNAEEEELKDLEIQDPFGDKDERLYEDLQVLFKKNANIRELLEQQKFKGVKSSTDVVLEALIKEVENKSFSVLDSIIEAYSSERGNSHLKSFLFHFLRTKTLKKDIDECLEKMAFNVDASDFFYLTELLWFRLADEKGIEHCCTKITELENKIGYIPPESLSVFYLHFCTRYIFDLEEKFLVEKMDLIEDCSSEFYWREDNEANFLTLLYDYRESLESFLTSCPTRQKLHKIIETWCKTEESLKHRAFINEAVNLDLKSILDRVGYGDSSTQACSEVIESICSEIKEGSWEEDIYEENEKNNKVRIFMLKIEEDTDQSSLGTLNTFTICTVLVFHLSVVLVPSIYGYNYLWNQFSENLQLSFWRFLILAGIIIGIGALYFFLGFVPVQDKFDNISNSVARRLYRKLWRGEVIQFLRQYPINFNELHTELIYMENTSGITNNSDMYMCMSKDYSLRIFSSIYSLQI